MTVLQLQSKQTGSGHSVMKTKLKEAPVRTSSSQPSKPPPSPATRHCSLSRMWPLLTFTALGTLSRSKPQCPRGSILISPQPWKAFLSPLPGQVNTAVICLGVKNTNVLESESVTAGRDPGDGSVQLPHFTYKETDAQGCAVTCLKSYNGLVAIYF